RGGSGQWRRLSRCFRLFPHPHLCRRRFGADSGHLPAVVIQGVRCEWIVPSRRQFSSIPRSSTNGVNMSRPVSPTSDPLSDRFSTYVLPGRAEDPTVAVQQARDAQAIGLGGVWLAERYAIKEPGIHCGALAQAAPGLKIGGTFQCHMGHPLVTASAANLIQAYTGNRFILVVARPLPAHSKSMGMPVLTLVRTREFIHIARRMWAGETVSHSGTLGEFVNLRLTDRHDAPP